MKIQHRTQQPPPPPRQTTEAPPPPKPERVPNKALERKPPEKAPEPTKGQRIDTRA